MFCHVTCMSGTEQKVCFFCFKQKTEFEMRISDWSSDVCSSDLLKTVLGELLPKRFAQRLCEHWLPNRPMRQFNLPQLREVARSEKRRVGKACVSTWRSRW